MISPTKPVALITGATSGIGAAIARRFSADGFAVILHGRSSAQAGRAMVAEMTDAASKAGLVHMTKLLAVSLAPAIRVNAIAPGLVATPMTADWDAAQTLWRERAPMRRAAAPEDIAEIAAMLVAMKYIGEIVTADGGLNLT